MARNMMNSDTSMSGAPSVAMPVEELRGRTVWTDAGTEIGKLRGFQTDDDGRITALEVQHGWMFGQRHLVDADAMRIDEGSVVVPVESVHPVSKRRAGASSVATTQTERTTMSPTLIAGRSGARSRFGGLSAAAGLIGALVAIASAVLIGGVMTAIFDSVETVTFDGTISSWSDLGSDAMIGGAVTLALASLIGGWAAGRVARFDGGVNGASVVAWLVVLGAVFAGLGAWLGDAANVFATADVPQVQWSDVTGVAVMGIVIMAAIMLVIGAVGGMLGSWYNHAVDRSMLAPARLGVVDGVDFADDSVTSGSTLVHDETGRHDLGVIGTPAGSPVAPKSMPTTDSSRDARRFD